MTKLLKKSVRKAETDRSTTEKVVRNIIFVALIAFASIMTYKVIDAETALTEAEMQAIPTNTAPYSSAAEKDVTPTVDMPTTTGETTTEKVDTTEAPATTDLPA